MHKAVDIAPYCLYSKFVPYRILAPAMEVVTGLQSSMPKNLSIHSLPRKGKPASSS